MVSVVVCTNCNHCPGFQQHSSPYLKAMPDLKACEHLRVSNTRGVEAFEELFRGDSSVFSCIKLGQNDVRVNTREFPHLGTTELLAAA